MITSSATRYQEQLILYHCKTSLASQKVRLYLAEMKIPWSSKHIDLRQQEHITSNYRKVNPKGTVPSLFDKEKNILICNSTDILRYLEKNYVREINRANPSILPKVIAFCHSHERLHDPSLRTLSYVNIFMTNKNLSAIKQQRLLKIANQHPNKARGDFLKRVIRKDITVGEIESSKQQVVSSLAKINHLLSEQPCLFLFGNHYTMADAVATADLFRIEKVGLKNELDRHELVAMYYEKMVHRENFNQADMC